MERGLDLGEIVGLKTPMCAFYSTGYSLWRSIRRKRCEI